MAYICEFDRRGISRKDNELFVEWLEADGKTAAEIKYVRERTCKNVDEEGSPWFTCSNCGETTSTEWFCAGFGQGSFCPNCGARIVGHETRNMSDKENKCEGCAIPNRDYGHAPSPCNFCSRNNEERYDLYTPAKVVE